jgi:cytochrome P450
MAHFAHNLHIDFPFFSFEQTTAHALAYTFALLALHQDEQEKLYEHIKSVIPDGRMPVSLLFVSASSP